MLVCVIAHCNYEYAQLLDNIYPLTFFLGRCKCGLQAERLRSRDIPEVWICWRQELALPSPGDELPFPQALCSDSKNNRNAESLLGIGTSKCLRQMFLPPSSWGPWHTEPSRCPPCIRACLFSPWPVSAVASCARTGRMLN